MKQINGLQLLTWAISAAVILVNHQFPQYSGLVTDLVTLAAAGGLHLHLTPDPPAATTQAK